jgi:hypothetical protein
MRYVDLEYVKRRLRFDDDVADVMLLDAIEDASRFVAQLLERPADDPWDADFYDPEVESEPAPDDVKAAVALVVRYFVDGMGNPENIVKTVCGKRYAPPMA